MKFGLNYITYATRPEFVQHSLQSLSKTNVEGLVKPTLRISYKPSGFDYESYKDSLGYKFNVSQVADPAHYTSMAYAACDSALRLLDEDLEVTHVVHLCDDRIFNPEWLHQLQRLIERHPTGVAWSVYRSATVAYHQIIGTDGTDVKMNMHDAIGCTTREEWQGFIQAHGYTACPDIYHATLRPGDRWATGRDYMQNIGVHFETDWAIDFVREE